MQTKETSNNPNNNLLIVGVRQLQQKLKLTIGCTDKRACCWDPKEPIRN